MGLTAEKEDAVLVASLASKNIGLGCDMSINKLLVMLRGRQVDGKVLLRGMRMRLRNSCILDLDQRRQMDGMNENGYVENIGSNVLQEVEQGLVFSHAKEPTDFLLYSTAASIEVEENSVVTLMSRDLPL